MQNTVKQFGLLRIATFILVAVVYVGGQNEIIYSSNSSFLRLSLTVVSR